MSVGYIPDINIWVALSIPAHTHHAIALQWAQAEPEVELHFCRYTQQGLLRLLTTSAVTSLFGQKPLSNHLALKRMEELLQDPRIRFASEPNGIYSPWSDLADVRTASPKLWMDAYLAAFAIAGGYRIVTTDKGFRQFKGLSALVL